MGRFNLVDEPWILVISDEKGAVEEVSLKTLFKNAHEYKALAGESQMQNFAIMRFLLAILHTVFSRVDANGRPYLYLELDDRLSPKSAVNKRNSIDYSEDLINTLRDINNKGVFPDVVCDYLELWKDRFNLFDDIYPFYQVNLEEIYTWTINKTKLGKISPRTFNRTISESGNKKSLFSPRMELTKDEVDEAEVARWLILFQGVVGTSDKVKFEEDSSEIKSKGWIYDLGGVLLSGNSLFESLLLNLALIHPMDLVGLDDISEVEDLDRTLSIQKPCWEYSGKEVLDRLINEYPIDNIAELYTNWSRAVYISPDSQLDKDFGINIVKLPQINHINQFIEPMTKWRLEENNGFSPEKHNLEKSFWRSFGSLFIDIPNSDEKKGKSRRPGIIEWFYRANNLFEGIDISFESYGIESDRNATSWVPVDEYFDNIIISQFVLDDLENEGWVYRIFEEIEIIEKVIGRTLREFSNEVAKIRNIETKPFSALVVSQAFYQIDEPFRNWMASIRLDDEKDKKVEEWRNQLRKIISEEARKIVGEASTRDYKGVRNKDKGQFSNIAIAYNTFNYWLNVNLG